MAGDKTEKATPKKREESRKKGQVAKSADLNGAVVVLAALLSLSALGPRAWTTVMDATRELLELVATRDPVTLQRTGPLLLGVAQATALAAGPLLLVCVLAGVLVNLGQVGFKPSAHALKPDPKRLDPIQGAKGVFGSRAVFETGKGIVKLGAVGLIAFTALYPHLEELGALVGMPPGELLGTLCSLGLSIARRAAFAYLGIAVVDVAWQRYSFEKKMRMDKQEVKDESKSQGVAAEIKSAQRRRQMQAAQGRMMDEIPTADVVVMNPTHFAVALRYSTEQPAPVCVAKGQDLLALRIRELAESAGVTVVVEPPLARSLHASVEVGRMIPEDFFGAVAQLLAYVYRVAGSRARTS